MSLETLRSQLGGGTMARKLEAYYEGKSRLDALGVNIPPEVRVLEMVSPYPAMAVDVLAEVLTFIGYTLGDDSDDERLAFLKRAYQVNNMDSLIHLANTDALIVGGSAYVVAPGVEYPVITVHSAADVAVRVDANGRRLEALVRWRTDSFNRDNERYSHYTPGRIDVYHGGISGTSRPVRSIRTPFDVIPVVPQLNRKRIRDIRGRSEMLEVLALSDATSRTLTGLQVAQELEALPKRWIFANGIAEAMKKSGQSKIDAYMGYLNLGPEGGKVQQLNGAALDPIINTYKLYAQIISSITGIPPSMLGISTDNPASAEAMRVAKERLTSRGETKQRIFGDALEELARTVLAVAGFDTAGLEFIKTVWRDVATPSRASQQAMAMQAFQSGAISAKTMRDFLDLTPSQRQYEDDRETALTGMTRRKVAGNVGFGNGGNARSDSGGLPAAGAPSGSGDTGGDG